MGLSAPLFSTLPPKREKRKPRSGEKEKREKDAVGYREVSRFATIQSI